MREIEIYECFKCKGWTYDAETGDIKSHTGKIIKSKNNGYVMCSMRIDDKPKQLLGHRLAYFLQTNELPNVIDHINHNKSDNRFCNLRNVDNQKNGFNRQNVKGFQKNKNGKYQSIITLNNKRICLGTFETENQAKDAYIKAKNIYHII